MIPAHCYHTNIKPDYHPGETSANNIMKPTESAQFLEIKVLMSRRTIISGLSIKILVIIINEQFGGNSNNTHCFSIQFHYRLLPTNQIGASYSGLVSQLRESGVIFYYLYQLVHGTLCIKTYTTCNMQHSISCVRH